MSHKLDRLKNLLPVTKFQPPAARDTIERAVLGEQLRWAVSKHRLTLISAPAGSGKTTLAADMMHRASDTIVKWLSLDDGDNELHAFMLAMLLAILDDPESEILLMVQQGQIRPRQLVTVLINRLAEQPETPFILVLEDLHLLTDQRIYDYLDTFIEHLPAHVHILVTTRYDPPLALAKLLARGELAEIRLDALRFDHDEVDILLNQLLHLNIPGTLIDFMVDRTEGWIAGLRLLALSLEKIDEGKREQYITDLAQNDRYVFDLLAEEVLAQQREDICQFLLETSILDKLTPELCAGVLQQPDAADKLRELHRHNLFLVSLGDGTYRYHALFRDFLREQLKQHMPDQFVVLHRRAAEALGSSPEAVKHLLAAHDWMAATTLLVDIAHQQIRQSFIRFQTAHWVQELLPVLNEAPPWLELLLGAYLVQSGSLQQGREYLSRSLAAFTNNADLEGQFFALSYLSQSDHAGGTGALPRLGALLELHPDFGSNLERVHYHLSSSWGAFYQTQWDIAEHHLPCAIELADTSHNVACLRLAR